MNFEENAAAFMIRQQMLRAEHAANAAAEETSRLMAVMLSTRRELECPMARGAREIDRGYQALGRQIGSMRSLSIMHQGLHVVADEGDESWYGPSTTMEPKPTGQLRAVA